jgi:antitoxin YokJ
MLRNLLDRIGAAAGCRILPPAGLPIITAGHKLPGDLPAFYGLCGGVDLFVDAPFSIRISSPPELVVANPVIVGERTDGISDISDSWYITGRGEEASM